MKNIISAIAFAMIVLLAACREEAENPAELTQKAFDAAKKADWKSTLAFSSKAVKIAPHEPSALILNALAREAAGETEEAIRILKAGFSPESDNFMAQYTLGRLLLAQKRYEEAAPPLEKAKKLRPENMNALLLFGRVSEKLKRADTLSILGDLIFSKKFSNQSTALLWNESAVVFATKGDITKAVQALEMALAMNESHPYIQLNYAILLDYHPALAARRREAEKHYAAFLRLTEKRSDLAAEREVAAKRMKAL